MGLLPPLTNTSGFLYTYILKTAGYGENNHVLQIDEYGISSTAARWLNCLMCIHSENVHKGWRRSSDPTVWMQCVLFRKLLEASTGVCVVPSRPEFHTTVCFVGPSASSDIYFRGSVPSASVNRIFLCSFRHKEGVDSSQKEIVSVTGQLGRSYAARGWEPCAPSSELSVGNK